MLFFIVVLIFGCGLLLWAMRKELRWQRQKKVIVEPNVVPANTEKGSFDFRGLIVENSKLLAFLHNLDNDTSKKLRIIALIALPLAVLKFSLILQIGTPGFATIMMLVMVFVIVAPAIIVKSAVSSRSKVMMDVLPYFIDLVAVCVQSGMTIESSIKYISERFDDMDKNVASLMRHLTKRGEVCGLEEALTELYSSVDMTEIRMLTSLLQQSVHYGTALYDDLMHLSQDIRELQLLQAEEKIGKLSAKMSIPLILFIMFPITVLIAAPGIMRVLKHAIF